ncbi:unnamed protein product, partial [marine sediment metagenome]
FREITFTERLEGAGLYSQSLAYGEIVRIVSIGE